MRFGVAGLGLMFTLGPWTVAAASAQGPSDTAFVLARAGVVPENLAYDAPRDRFLGGDLEQDGLIEVRRDGSIRPFATAAGIDGRVLGLKIDAGRNLLWGVAFTRPRQAAGDTVRPPARSIVFALRLPDGAPVHRVASPADGASHVFNDLVVARNGAVYLTDSEAGAVWALEDSRLRLLHEAPPARFAYPNGIAFLPEERGLLVAYWQGLATIPLPRGPATALRVANDSLVGRIDGLYPACGGYVGIQNMATPSRIIAFRVEGDAPAGLRDVEVGRADFRGPTTGTIVRDTLFYVANAQIGPFDPRHEGGALEPVLVLGLPLRCGAGAGAGAGEGD
jgi:sugar lactone lactonase YvrE